MAFVGGRLELKAQGDGLERFLELLYRARIPLFRARKQDGILFFSIPPRYFKRLRAPAFQTGTRVRIVKKRGLFMLSRPFRRRFGLIAGALLFLGLLYYWSCFVWQIEVKGCEETSQTQILADLEAMGLKRGCPRTIDVGRIENLYLMGNKKLSWISINIRGTTAYVEVKEEGIPPQVVDLSAPSNIYAARDGVILSIRDYGGARQVEPGSAVAAGDLLVSGDRIDQYGVRHLMKSIATVIAQTERQTSVTIPLQQKTYQKTGKKRKKYSISLGNWKIPLYFNKKIDYNKYDTIEEVYPFSIGFFTLPLQWNVTTAEELQELPLERSVEEARAIAQAEVAFYEADRLEGVEVLRREVKEQLTQEGLTLYVTFYCEEEIGVELPIEN